MVNYEVTVHTADLNYAGTFNNVFIKLVGTKGKSNRTWLISLKGPFALYRGAVSTFTVYCPEPIGKLVQIELDKQRFPLFLEDSWFPTKVVVKSPEGPNYKFPIYRWINDCEVHHFREATALRNCDDAIGKQELAQREKDYRWHNYGEGIPHGMEAESLSSLPCEVQFSYTKQTGFIFTASIGLLELILKGFSSSKENWTDIDANDHVFWDKNTAILDHVRKNWRDDALFGYQFLNGVNPMLIRCCSVLPENFPVTDAMVSFGAHCSLADEMKKGNIFLCDYKNLEGLKPNTIDDEEQYLMAPLVLLHKTPDDKLMPIAIQLKQTPAHDNPIFFPTDPANVWLLAKIFVRGADFNEHQVNTHLLRTHLLAEVFAVSLLRNVPMVHPLYKLLIPHTRYTLHINYLARDGLISKGGVLEKFAAAGGEGLKTLMKKSLDSLTYSSLCIHEDIAERGLENVPNFYYRDDGRKLWDIIHRFVKGVLSFYYNDDADLKTDCALQKWIKDIFVHGFLSKEHTGIPRSFDTVDELIKFVTMVIFTCTGQHSAVNSGQYDYGGWMPNTPTTLRLPPPTLKEAASDSTVLQTVPNISTTVNGMATMWLLSTQSSDFVALGQNLEDHFSEEIPCQLIRAFQGELQVLSAHINIRNNDLTIPYTYMDPAVIENSVAI